MEFIHDEFSNKLYIQQVLGREPLLEWTRSKHYINYTFVIRKPL
jgi:hypothetical protein